MLEMSSQAWRLKNPQPSSAQPTARDIPAALMRYENARRDRTRRAVEGSAANIQRFHNPKLSDPAEARKYVDREWAEERIAERYEWLFRYDVTTVAI